MLCSFIAFRVLSPPLVLDCTVQVSVVDSLTLLTVIILMYLCTYVLTYTTIIYTVRTYVCVIMSVYTHISQSVIGWLPMGKHFGCQRGMFLVLVLHATSC